MGSNFATESSLVADIPQLGRSLGFLYGPWIYLYARNLVYRDSQDFKRVFAHFVPAAGILATDFLHPIPKLFLAGALATSLAIYLWKSFELTKHFRTVIDGLRSDGDRIELKWFRQILYFLCIAGLLDLGQSITGSGSADLQNIFYTTLTCGLTVMVNFMIFRGLAQPSLFAGLSSDEEQLVEDTVLAATGHSHETDRLQEIAERASAMMETNRLHRDPTLSLAAFAAEMGASPKSVSQAINSQIGENFSEFVNRHRLKEAVERLSNPALNSKTILEVLYEVGFNTKSNFYAIFKKEMGMTPVQFRNRQERPHQ